MKEMVELKDINFREKGFKDLTLMLLGSAKWEPLQHRKNVREEIKKYGYKNFGYKDIIIWKK